MTLRKQLSLLRLSYVVHRMPGFRWIGKALPPLLFFRWIRCVAHIAVRLYSPDRRQARRMRQVMRGSFDGDRLKRLGKRNAVYLKWSDTLEIGWPSWGTRCQDWVRFEGEEHLKGALEGGKGAILLSGHLYGFGSLVAPVLSQKGYPLLRTGGGQRAHPVERWGNQWRRENWDYNSFGKNYWQHVRALNRMRRATRDNKVLHLLVRGAPQGDPHLEVDFYYKRFFLDSNTFRIIETLEAPVLPCFALCDDTGRLLINIYPALSPVTEKIMEIFGPLYAKHLKEMPEFGQFWKSLAEQRRRW